MKYHALYVTHCYVTRSMPHTDTYDTAVEARDTWRRHMILAQAVSVLSSGQMARLPSRHEARGRDALRLHRVARHRVARHARDALHQLPGENGETGESSEDTGTSTGAGGTGENGEGAGSSEGAGASIGGEAADTLRLRRWRWHLSWLTFL